MGFTHHDNLGLDSAVDYLLISTPNLLVGNRIDSQLSASGIHTRSSELGLEVWCNELDWRLIVESIATTLTPVERHDTRIARINVNQDPSAIHRAIFRARSIDELLREAGEIWLGEVLANDRIVIHFQPLMQYPPGRVHGYECLMRGVDGDGKLIAPDRIFQAASTLECLRALDEKCRRAAIRACAAVNDPNLSFFINFLPSAVERPEAFISSLLRELDGGGLRPQQIVLEVVETDRVQDQKHVSNLLRRLRKAGFKIALDDVGSGYASLLSLSRLRPDYIKLDGELVRRAAFSTLEAKMIADLAETARQNGIITVAEGIETEQQLRLVLESGIRLTQGYIHSRPQPGLLAPEKAHGVLDRLRSAAEPHVAHPAA